MHATPPSGVRPCSGCTGCSRATAIPRVVPPHPSAARPVAQVVAVAVVVAAAGIPRVARVLGGACDAAAGRDRPRRSLSRSRPASATQHHPQAEDLGTSSALPSLVDTRGRTSSSIGRYFCFMNTKESGSIRSKEPLLALLRHFLNRHEGADRTRATRTWDRRNQPSNQ